MTAEPVRSRSVVEVTAAEISQRPVDGQWRRPSEAIALVCRGRTTRTAVPIAVAVGTVLSAVNQGAVIVTGRSNAATWVRVVVNYLVPFIVASAGWLSARRWTSREVVSAPPDPLNVAPHAIQDLVVPGEELGE